MLLPEHTFGELIPGPDLPARVTAYRARMLAAEYGEAVTSKQLRAFQRAGLTVPGGSDGTYEGVLVNQLIALKRTGRVVRPLPRRVVFLRGYYPLFPVSPDRLQQALVEMAPTVHGAARKLARLSRSGRSRGEASLRQPSLPPAKVWDGLLQGASPELVEAWATGWYAMARDVIPAYYAPRTSPLDDIPLEEQVLLLAILDLNQRQSGLRTSVR